MPLLTNFSARKRLFYREYQQLYSDKPDKNLIKLAKTQTFQVFHKARKYKLKQDLKYTP